jgi:hypothetical protein
MGHPVVVFLLLLLCMWFYVSEWFKNLTVVVNHTWLFVDGYTQCQDFREFYYWVSCTVAWLFEDEEICMCEEDQRIMKLTERSTPSLVRD